MDKKFPIIVFCLYLLYMPLYNFTASADQQGSQANPYPVWQGWQGPGYYIFVAHNFETGYINTVCDLNNVSVQNGWGNLGSPYDISSCTGVNNTPPPPPPSTPSTPPPPPPPSTPLTPSSTYVVVFSGSTQPTYSNFADYTRIVVIGNNAYTMGDASDSYVASNNISLVADGTDQNTYAASHNLHLVCCGDLAILALQNNAGSSGPIPPPVQPSSSPMTNGAINQGIISPDFNYEGNSYFVLSPNSNNFNDFQEKYIKYECQPLTETQSFIQSKTCGLSLNPPLTDEDLGPLTLCSDMLIPIPVRGATLGATAVASIEKFLAGQVFQKAENVSCLTVDLQTLHDITYNSGKLPIVGFYCIGSTSFENCTPVFQEPSNIQQLLQNQPPRGTPTSGAYTISSNSIPPSIPITVSFDATTSGDTVTVTPNISDPNTMANKVAATYSSNPNSPTETLTWNWGDQMSSTTDGSYQNSHIYDIPNSYTITLVVTDIAGISGKYSKTVNIATTSNAQNTANNRYNLSFQENYLPIGSQWSISIDTGNGGYETKNEVVANCNPSSGTVEICPANTIEFTVNGNYGHQYYVGPPAGYSTNLAVVDPSGGNSYNSQYVIPQGQFTIIPVDFFQPQTSQPNFGVDSAINTGTGIGSGYLERNQWLNDILNQLNEQLKGIRGGLP